eukprot:TCALIF_02768-PA protein Name:"Similar to SAT2 Diamine acetyltransferase 2 (Sus scrofa)" AED:0.15 eAED:0.15 QI:63/0.5/0.6/1/0.5/0.6/5/35/283
MDAQFSIRPAIETDCSEILRLIQELADYEKMPDGPKIGAEVLIGDGFNNAEAAYYHCLVAESQDAPGQLVAYCLYFYTYSTDVGRCVYMEDLYVSPNFRSKGLGKSLWQTLVKNALERDCVRCEFVVLDWNQSSIEFYHLQGAKNMSSQEGWVQLRMNESVMASFKAPKTLSNTKVRRALKSDGPKIWNLIMEQTGMDGRNKGIGQSLLEALLKVGEPLANENLTFGIAVDKKCVRCNFKVHKSNEASLTFFSKIGSQNISSDEGWLLYRMDRNAMEEFIKVK